LYACCIYRCVTFTFDVYLPHLYVYYWFVALTVRLHVCVYVTRYPTPRHAGSRSHGCVPGSGCVYHTGLRYVYHTCNVATPVYLRLTRLQLPVTRCGLFTLRLPRVGRVVTGLIYLLRIPTHVLCCYAHIWLFTHVTFIVHLVLAVTVITLHTTFVTHWFTTHVCCSLRLPGSRVTGDARLLVYRYTFTLLLFRWFLHGFRLRWRIHITFAIVALYTYTFTVDTVVVLILFPFGCRLLYVVGCCCLRFWFGPPHLRLRCWFVVTLRLRSLFTLRLRFSRIVAHCTVTLPVATFVTLHGSSYYTPLRCGYVPCRIYVCWLRFISYRLVTPHRLRLRLFGLLLLFYIYTRCCCYAVPVVTFTFRCCLYVPLWVYTTHVWLLRFSSHVGLHIWLVYIVPVWFHYGCGYGYTVVPYTVWFPRVVGYLVYVTRCYRTLVGCWFRLPHILLRLFVLLLQ